MRPFSAISPSSVVTSPVIRLNDSASSPSWSRARTGIWWREVAGAHVLRAGEEIVHGAGDLPRQHEADHQRDELDDQEQRADERQHASSSWPKFMLPRPAGDTTEMRS